jgi:RNA polymerase sigma factor (TIGR02999 family)
MMYIERDITQMLTRARAGEPDAVGELMPMVYDELRALADRYLRGERPGHTLQATALVHEAYLRLTGGAEVDYNDRTHFFATAATAIRRILVEHARRRSRLKRGGELVRVPLENDIVGSAADPIDARMLALDDALQRLTEVDPQKGRIVEMRFFAGLTVDEVARCLDVSSSTVTRDWRLARAWLKSELAGTGGNED